MKREEIIELRANLKMTQKEFAKAIGVSRSVVQNWENGNRKPMPKALHVLKKLKED